MPEKSALERLEAIEKNVLFAQGLICIYMDHGVDEMLGNPGLYELHETAYCKLDEAIKLAKKSREELYQQEVTK